MKWSGAHIWDRSTRPVFWSTESVNHTLSGSLPWPPKADHQRDRHARYGPGPDDVGVEQRLEGIPVEVRHRGEGALT